MNPPYPSALRGWLIVAVLVIAYAVSFVDRQILGLLVADLRRDLAISDAQIGLLQGPAFGVFYALMGMPFGWLADRTHRIRLISAGLMMWTLMTLAGGLATTFGWLFLTRVGVGVGEAALVPAAVSLLADSFAPQRRPLPLATFTAGVSLGAGLALVLGGTLVGFARQGVGALPLVGPWLATRAAWQSVLMMAGALGVPVALAILTLPEPVRRPEVHGDRVVGLVHHLRAHRGLFTSLFAGSSLLYLFANALSSWMPTIFIRAFGWNPADVGVQLGVMVLTGAVSGTLLSGVLATWMVRRRGIDGTLLTMILGATLLIPCSIGGLLADDARVVQFAVMAIYFAISLCFGVATATFVAITPAALRGRIVALYLLLGNLVGLGIGPPAVGLLVDHVFHDPARVATALACVAIATVLPGAWLLARCLRPYRRLATFIAG